MKVFFLLVITSLVGLGIATENSTNTDVPVAEALIRRIVHRPKSLKRSSGFPLHHPRIINQKPPVNVLQNGPYYINHYIYCDNLDQHTVEQIKSGSISASEIQLIKDKYPGFSSLDTSLNGFKVDTYTGDKEIHILHLPTDKPHDLDDINLHLNLANAHKSPEIDLELNKHFGSFEVNLASIKPPKAEISLLPTQFNEFVHTPVKSYAEILKPLVDGISEIPHKYTNANSGSTYSSPTIKEHSEEQSFEEEEEEIEIPHLENHPLENDPNKPSYNSPGAVNSYGEPVKPTINLQNTHSFYSSPSKPNLAHLTSSDIKDPSYNSPGAVDSYGNPATAQNLQNSLDNEKLLQQAYYLNQLNEIHDISRRRRQESRRSSSEEVRHPNHRYD